MIRFQILRGLLAKKPTLKDGELFLNKTDHSVVIQLPLAANLFLPRVAI